MFVCLCVWWFWRDRRSCFSVWTEMVLNLIGRVDPSLHAGNWDGYESLHVWLWWRFTWSWTECPSLKGAPARLYSDLLQEFAPLETRQAVSSLWRGWSALNFVLQWSEPAGTSPSRGHTWTLVKWITLQLDTDTWEHKARVEKFLFKLSALWHPTDSHLFLMQFFTWETHLNNSLCCHYLACTISTAADSHSLHGWAKKKISAFVSELLFLYVVCSSCALGHKWCISNEMSFEMCP